MKQQEAKVILSLPLARRLIKAGYPLIDVEPSHRRRGMVAFVFTNSEALDNEITRYVKLKGE